MNYTDYILDKNSNLILPNLIGIDPSESSYLTSDIFTHYFDKIIYDSIILNTNSVCNTQSNSLSDYFIVINFIDFTYKVPNNLIKSLKKCNKDTRFYIIQLKLVFDYQSAHSNVIIIDNLNKTIELFEPHGKQYGNSLYNIEYHIKKLLINLFPSFSNYTFRNVQSSCPIGVQSLQNIINPKSGHCLAWSLLFTQIKIQNLLVSTDSIINFLLKIDNIDLYMRKYIGFLELYTMFIPKKETDINYEIQLLPEEILIIGKRITYLINLYKNDNTNNKESIFQELIGYHKFKDFDKLFFKNIDQNKKRKLNINNVL